MSDYNKDQRYLDDMIADAQAYIDDKEREFHGYRGDIAHLKDGRFGKIMDGKGLKLFLQDVDGNVIECYYDDLAYIFAP